MKKLNWKCALPALVAFLFASCNLIQEMPKDFVETYGNIAYVEKVEFVGLAEESNPPKVTETKNFRIIYTIKNDGNFDLSPEFTFEGCEIKNPSIVTEKKSVSITIAGENLKSLENGAEFNVKLTLYKASQKVLQSSHEIGMRYVYTGGPEVPKGTVEIKIPVPDGYTLEIKGEDSADFEIKPDGNGNWVIKSKGEIPEDEYDLTIIVKDEDGNEIGKIEKKIDVSEEKPAEGFSDDPDGEPFEITEEMIEKMVGNTFYVRGNDAPWYNRNDQDAVAKDDNLGDKKHPFATIQKAIATVIARNNADESVEPNNGTDEYTIYIDGTLDGATATHIGANGMADFSALALNKDLKLTIKSLSESDKATLDAGSSSRVMNANPAGGKLDLTLENLVITRGNATGDGGGICFDSAGGTLTVKDCEISGNAAANGGGLYVAGGALTVKGCEISDNNATQTGGGIYVAGTFTAEGSTIRDNDAGQSGGGVYLAGSADASKIESGAISKNTAGQYGGGIYVDGGALTMSGGTITDNEATTFNGGGVYAKNATLTMSGTAEISRNTAKVYGGGVRVDGGSFEMTGGTISDNKVTGSNGGGVHVYNSGKFTMTSGAITGNTATGNGGGICSSSMSNLVKISGDATISRNTASSNGGGIYTDLITLIMEGGTISDNKAKYGGGVASTSFTMKGGTISGNTATTGGGVRAGSTFEMTGGTISDNNASGNGGGIYKYGGNTRLKISSGATISRNIATGSGGGIYILDDCTFTMDGGTISDNKATSGDGGGVYSEKAKFTLSGNGAISGNTASNDGGGVYIDKNATFKMTGGTIGGANPSDANSANYGGGVYFKNCTTAATMSGGEISGNTANNQGGGVYLYGSDLTISDSAKVAKNTATSGYGGGIYIFHGAETGDRTTATLTMTGGEVSGNNAASGYGGGVYNQNGEFVMNGTAKISGNTATSGDGGGVCVANGGTFTMSDGTIGGANTAKYGGGVCVNGIFTMSGGKISGNTTTSGNGGGVFVYGSSASFTMTGGEVSDNKANSGNGGGVCSSNFGTFKMSSTAKISKNTAAVSGGGVYNSGTFTMSGGKISGNTASDCGGGVNVNSGTFTMSGGTIGGTDDADKNKASLGGGVYVKTGTFKMSGAANVAEGNDVYLEDTNKITIAGSLTEANVATITPATYAPDKLVLSAVTSVTITQDICNKFAVTKQSELNPAKKWKVALSGNSGVLKEDTVSTGGGGISVTLPDLFETYTFKVMFNGNPIEDNDEIKFGNDIILSEVKDSKGNTPVGPFTIAIQEGSDIDLDSKTDTTLPVTLNVPLLPFDGMPAQIRVKVQLSGGYVIDKRIPVIIKP